MNVRALTSSKPPAVSKPLIIIPRETLDGPGGGEHGGQRNEILLKV